jgi:hypothetical protein
MKNLRQICATLALTLVFALPAFADGYISLDKRHRRRQRLQQMATYS